MLAMFDQEGRSAEWLDPSSNENITRMNSFVLTLEELAAQSDDVTFTQRPCSSRATTLLLFLPFVAM